MTFWEGNHENKRVCVCVFDEYMYTGMQVSIVQDSIRWQVAICDDDEWNAKYYAVFIGKELCVR